MGGSEIFTKLQILRYAWPTPLMIGIVVLLVLFTELLGVAWHMRYHFLFEMGLVIGLLASMWHASRLRGRRDLSPRWVFYLNLSGIGFYILIIVLINWPAIFR